MACAQKWAKFGLNAKTPPGTQPSGVQYDNSFYDLWRLDPPDRLIWRVKASGCVGLGGDDLRHRPVIAEGPAPAARHVACGDGGFDLAPSAVSRKADHSIARARTG